MGRAQELELLASALQNPPAAVVLEGEAGTGKTRLVTELRAWPELAGATVMVGGARPIREPFPLGPVIDAVRGLGAALTRVRLSPLAGALRPLLPELTENLPPAPEPLHDPAAERHRVFRALMEILGAVGPVVLALEDLHWADEQTLEGLYRREADGSRTSLGPDQGPLVETDVKTVRFSPNNPDLILLDGADYGVAGTEATVWRSADRGRTWTKAYEGSQSLETVFDLEIVAGGTDQEVVGSVATTAMERAVLRSEDGGRSWSASTIGLSGPQFGSAMPQLCTSSADPHVVYLATSPALSMVSVFRSLDGGVTWQPTGWSQAATIMDLACDPADGRVVYLLSNGEARAMRSQDAGATFSPFDAGIQGLRLPRSLAFVEASRLLLASSKGSYVRDLERDTISADASAHKEKGRPITDLSWDGATSTEMDVYRDGTLVATVPNDGSYTETLDLRGHGTVTYQVCRADSSICSNNATVQF